MFSEFEVPLSVSRTSSELRISDAKAVNSDLHRRSCSTVHATFSVEDAGINDSSFNYNITNGVSVVTATTKSVEATYHTQTLALLN